MPGPDTAAAALDPEDAKILTLARAARSRAYAPHTGGVEGAAVRDTDGRTYAAGTVENADPRLTTSAIRAAVAAAVSSGARRLEAVALVTERSVMCSDDVAVIAEFGGAPVLLAGPDGALAQTLTVGAEGGGVTDLPLVRLRPLVATDAALLEAAYVESADPYSWPGHRRHGWMLAAITDGTIHSDDVATLAVTDEAGTVLGDVQYRRTPTGSGSFSWCWALGISLLPEWRGRGFGAAAQRELARYLFRTTTAERVEADTDVDNLAEQGALEKAGYTREGVRRRSMWRDGSWHDTVGYAVLRGDLP